MKTSLFKRKPDLESAANSYSQAGSCFRVAKDFKQAVESCKKAAECFAQNNALFSAAKLATILLIYRFYTLSIIWS